MVGITDSGDGMSPEEFIRFAQREWGYQVSEIEKEGWDIAIPGHPEIERICGMDGLVDTPCGISGISRSGRVTFYEVTHNEKGELQARETRLASLGKLDVVPNDPIFEHGAVILTRPLPSPVDASKSHPYMQAAVSAVRQKFSGTKYGVSSIESAAKPFELMGARRMGGMGIYDVTHSEDGQMKLLDCGSLLMLPNYSLSGMPSGHDMHLDQMLGELWGQNFNPN